MIQMGDRVVLVDVNTWAAEAFSGYGFGESSPGVKLMRIALDASKVQP